MSKENKLTLADCFKYPNAKTRGDHATILERIKSGCVRGIESSQLQLRSIKSLTDEEKLKLSEIYYSQEGKDITIYYDFIYFDFPIEAITAGDYLRSISVDIDGFEESGKAILESEGK